MVIAVSVPFLSSPSIEIGGSFSAPPTEPTGLILWVSPAHGEQNVSVYRPIVIAFALPQEELSIVLVSAPPIADLSYEWTNDTIVTFSHLPFAECATHSIFLDAVPGTALGDIPNPWSFTTGRRLAPGREFRHPTFVTSA